MTSNTILIRQKISDEWNYVNLPKKDCPEEIVWDVDKPIEFPPFSPDYYPWGYTLLTLAIRNSNCDEIQELLEFGANPNVKDKNGWYPLALAMSYEVLNKDIPMTKLLLQYGAKTCNLYVDNVLECIFCYNIEMLLSVISSDLDIESAGEIDPQGAASRELYDALESEGVTRDCVTPLQLIKVLIQYEYNWYKFKKQGIAMEGEACVPYYEVDYHRINECKYMHYVIRGELAWRRRRFAVV